MGGRCPAVVYEGPYWGAEWWARVPGQQASRGVAAHPRGRALRRLRHPPGVVDWRCPAGGQGGVPRTSRRAQGGGGGPVEEEGRDTVLGHDHPGQGRPGRSTQEIISAIS